jgi:hypothetical protein
MLPACVLNEFDAHAARLRSKARARREAVAMRSVVNDTEEREEASVEETLGKRMPADEYQGDVNLRTLRALLKQIDERGFERCAARTLPLPVKGGSGPTFCW